MWSDLVKIFNSGLRLTRTLLLASLLGPWKQGTYFLHPSVFRNIFFMYRTDNGELLNLIDATGCPVNELIFPALNLEDASRALSANFKAFRFPSTPTVNFVATVQFCQDVCDPVSCTGELLTPNIF